MSSSNDPNMTVIETPVAQGPRGLAGPPGPRGPSGDQPDISPDEGNSIEQRANGIYVPDTLAGKVDSVAGKQGDVLLDKDDVGLGAVDNTSDADKPISIAVADALERIEQTAGQPGQPGEQGDPGPAGPSVELNVGSTHIQWRVEGEAEWQDLIALASLTPSVESVVDAVVVQIGSQLMPAGGTAGQVLAKVSDVDYDMDWVDSGPPPELGRLIASYKPERNYSYREVNVFDLNTLDMVNVLPQDVPNSQVERFPYSTVTNKLYVSAGSAAYEIDLSTLEQLQTISGSMSRMAIMSKDGSRYYALKDWGDTFDVVDLSADPPTVLWSVADGYRACSLDPEGNLYCIKANTGDTEIRIYDHEGAYTLAPAAPENINELFMISPDGTKAITRKETGGNLLVLDLSDMSIIEERPWHTTYHVGNAPPCIWSTDSTMIAVKTRDLESNSHDSDAIIWTIGESDPQVLSLEELSGEEQGRISVGGHCFNGDSSRYYLCGDKGVYELDTTNWEMLRKIDAAEAHIGWLPNA